jgi:hypothetical protein
VSSLFPGESAQRAAKEGCLVVDVAFVCDAVLLSPGGRGALMVIVVDIAIDFIAAVVAL